MASKSRRNSSKINEVTNFIELEMIDLAEVKDLKWSDAKGQRLKELRGSVSRRVLSEMMAAAGSSCSERYIQRIEENDIAGINLEMLKSLMQCLGLDLGAIVVTSKTRISMPS